MNTADRGSFDTQNPKAPDVFSLGVITIRGLHSLPGTLSYSIGEQKRLQLSLMEIATRTLVSCFSVGMFQADQHQELEKLRDWFFNGRKTLRIGAPKIFDESMLALKSPSGSLHGAFHMKGSGRERRIFHTYPSEGSSVLVRYLLPSATIANHPRFHSINAGFTISPESVGYP